MSLNTEEFKQVHNFVRYAYSKDNLEYRWRVDWMRVTLAFERQRADDSCLRREIKEGLSQAVIKREGADGCVIGRTWPF